MKNLKKLISVIIAVIMIVGSFATVSAADYADVESTNSYAKAIQVLSGLGIAKGDDEGNFNPKNEVKRSEMVAFICRAMGEEDVAAGSATNAFTDVAANHWAAGEIAWGVNRGIINGMGDGTFAPDASVSYQDAVVMIMRALGYDRIAQRKENGGYPVGYLKLASQYGVLKDAGYDNTAAATREIIAQLIFNGLTAAMVDVTEYGDSVEDDKYVIYNGKNRALKNLLTDVNDMYRVKIEITATPKTDATNCVDKNGNEMVKVDLYDACDYYEISRIASKLGFTAKTVYNQQTQQNEPTGYYETKLYVGETDVADYLGYTFEAYIAEDDDLRGNIILAAVAEEKAIVTETIKVGLADATYTAGQNGADDVYAYLANETDRKATEIKVDPSAMIYYNGVEFAAVSANINGAVIANGTANSAQDVLRAADSITFMGDKNAAYDKIFVTDYSYKRVKSVDAAEEFIKFENFGALELHEDIRGEDFIYNIYDAEGNAIALEDIKANDILNIVAPAKNNVAYDLDNAAFLDIYVTSNSVTGKVAEMLDNSKYVVIDDKTYGNFANVTASDEGEFFISIDGKIVDKEASAIISKNFAFLMGVDQDASFNAKSYEVRLFTTEGKEVDVPVADVLTIYQNGNKTVYRASNNELDALFQAADANNNIQAGTFKALTADQASTGAAEALIDDRFFSYRTNADGELIEMRFAANNTEIEVSNLAARAYDADYNEFAGESVEDTILFVAPVSNVAAQNQQAAYNVKADDLAIGNFEILDESATYSSYLYTFEDKDEPAVALFTVPATPGLKYTSLAVVQATGTALDANGIAVANYTFVQSGAIVKAAMAADKDGVEDVVVAAQGQTPAELLAVGDVVQYAVNAAGEITDIDVIYDASAKALTGTATAYNLSQAKAGFVFGIVTEFDSKLVLAKQVQAANNSNIEIEAVSGQTAQFKVNETEASTYAFYDASLAQNKVKQITINGVKATRRNDVVYAAIARQNGKANDKVEDIVLIQVDGLTKADNTQQVATANINALNAISWDITANGNANN